jgi:hypothetical protein
MQLTGKPELNHGCHALYRVIATFTTPRKEFRGQSFVWTEFRVDRVSCGQSFVWTEFRVDRVSCGQSFVDKSFVDKSFVEFRGGVSGRRNHC